MEQVAAIVLAGGRSSRMGRPKATLPWHGQTLVARTAGILARALPGPVVVVRAPGQPLPPLGQGIDVIEDEREGRGPLEGIAAGLRAVEHRAEVAYVSSTDVPLLRPAFVKTVVALLDSGSDIAVPYAGERFHPLAAAYRTMLRPAADALLKADRLRVSFLLDAARVRRIEESELRSADPGLESLINLNDPAGYERAAALPPPEVHVTRGLDLQGSGANGMMLVRAATLGAAAAVAEVELGDLFVAIVNGLRCSDPELPLVEGDSVVFTRWA